MNSDEKITPVSLFKAKEDFNASIKLLEDSIKQYHLGITEYYRIIAVQLWILLCDKLKRSEPLIKIIFSDFKLHPLRGLMPNEKGESLLMKYHQLLGPNHRLFPVHISGDGKSRPKAKILFDERQEPLELSEWLSQPFLSEEITFYEFMKSVRHKIGAHSDPEYNDVLSSTKSLKITNVVSLEMMVVALGEYVLKQIHSKSGLLGNTFEGDVSS